MAAQARRDPRVKATIEAVRDLDGLKGHPAWVALRREIVGKRERIILILTRRLMSGDVVSQQEIDFQRGFIAGAEWVLEIPETADANLERAARDAWARAQLELTAEGDAEPYG